MAACTAATRSNDSNRSAPPLVSLLSGRTARLHSCSSTVGRLRHQRSRFRARLIAIENTQGRNCRSRRNFPRCCHTRTNVSCANSSASPAFSTIRAMNALIAASHRSISTPRAASSPVCTRCISSVSSLGVWGTAAGTDMELMTMSAEIESRRSPVVELGNLRQHQREIAPPLVG